MSPKIQEELLQAVKLKLSPGETIGFAFSEVLSVSQDAAYRRLRNETAQRLMRSKSYARSIKYPLMV